MRLFNIILVVLALASVCGCKSHRETVRHDEVRYQRTIQDSTVSKVDSMARRDSVSLSWVAGEVSLELDSVDYRITWDSVGHPTQIAGKRLVSRRSSSTGQKAASTAVEETHEEACRQHAVQDSTAVESVQDKRALTKAGWQPGWLEIAGGLVLLLLAGCGVLYLRGLTERWSKRGR